MKKDVGVISLDYEDRIEVKGKDLSNHCYTRNLYEVEHQDDPEYPTVLKLGPTAVYCWQVMAQEDKRARLSVFIKLPKGFFATKSAHVRVLLCRGEEEEEVRVETEEVFQEIKFEMNCLFDTLFLLKICILTIDEAKRVIVGKIVLENKKEGE